MSVYTTAAPPARAESARPAVPFAPGALAFDAKPLDQWLSGLSAWYLALGTERGLLVSRTLADLASQARCCTTPGVPLSVEDFLDRKACLDAEADGAEWPPRGSWVDKVRYAPASPSRGERTERLAPLPAGLAD